jgi:hypothetical protein
MDAILMVTGPPPQVGAPSYTDPSPFLSLGEAVAHGHECKNIGLHSTASFPGPPFSRLKRCAFYSLRT